MTADILVCRIKEYKLKDLRMVETNKDNIANKLFLRVAGCA